MLKFGLLFVLVALFGAHYCHAYSARADALAIAQYRQQRREQREQQALQQEGQRANDSDDPPTVARKLVHQANWAAVGTISINKKILGFPMVNIISIDDCDRNSKSTGKIHFLLTDLDYTGPDWRHKNNVTMLFSDDQTLNCSKHYTDPMEPTCARTIISGKVVEMNTKGPGYKEALEAFIKRHPAAKEWIKHHPFYLCEFDIENIFVLNYYGGPKNVKPEDYYKVVLDDVELNSDSISEKYVYITINQVD